MESENQHRTLRKQGTRTKAKRALKIQYTNDVILEIIGAVNYNQTELDGLLNDLSSAHGSWFMEWIKENIHVHHTGGGAFELEWA